MSAKSRLKSRPCDSFQAQFTFESRVEVFDGPTPWYFLDLPPDLARELDELFADQKRGFGSLPVEALINGVVWQTSIFPNSHSKTFMLPLKADVRRRAGLELGKTIQVNLQICA